MRLAIFVLLLLTSCIPKLESEQKSSCKGENCPEAKLKKEADICQRTPGAIWNLERFCELPKNLNDCRRASMDYLWDGSKCTHVDSQANFYRFCVDLKLAESTKRTIDAVFDVFQTQNCQDAFTALSQAKTLKLQRAQISDLSPLGGLTDLIELSLWHNQISDPSPLGSCTNLQKLNLGKNLIADTNFVVKMASTMPNLKILELFENLIVDPSPLLAIKTLTRLDLSRNQINSWNGFDAANYKDGFFKESL